MNLKLKRFSAVLSAAAVLAIMTSCSSKAVMSYGDYSISENEFQYYLATYKGKFAQTYSDFSDTPEFFSNIIDENGSTAEEVLYDSVLHNVKMTLVCEELFDEYGLKLSSAAEDTINSYIENYIEDYSDGSKSRFNASLGVYGINVKMLKEIYLRDEKTSALFDALYGSGGLVGITDDERTDYLNDNYVRVRHIYVNNKYAYSYDEDGIPEYTEDGLRKTRGLTEEEQKAKQDLIDAIDASLAEGGDFEEVYKAFSEDKYYKNGYYLTESMNFIDEVISSGFDLTPGEYVKIESDFGTHYLMRLEMDEKPWEDDANADFFDDYDTVVAEDLFAVFVESHIEEVETDEEALAKYTIEDSPINYRF